jgi:hypothetical protein
MQEGSALVALCHASGILCRKRKICDEINEKLNLLSR